MPPGASRCRQQISLLLTALMVPGRLTVARANYSKGQVTMQLSVLLLFMATSLPIVLAPGPSVAYVTTTTLNSGRRSGLSAVLGVELGYVIHVVAAVAGLSAVVAASAGAFTVVKLAGACYLVWLGGKAWRSRDGRSLRDLAPSADAVPARRAFTRGLLIGGLNPKTAVFFLSFLPVFVQPTGLPTWAQMTILGLVFIAMATVPDTAWALGGSALRRLLPALRMKTMERISGTVFFGLAAYALTARRATA